MQVNVVPAAKRWVMAPLVDHQGALVSCQWRAQWKHLALNLLEHKSTQRADTGFGPSLSANDHGEACR
jgi:hypothetical protein